MAKDNVQKNRFKVAREIVEASDQDLRNRNAGIERSESLSLSDVLPAVEEIQGKNVAERYEKLMQKDVQQNREKRGKGRINLYVPQEVKDELDRMVERQEIKNLNHFINYLIADYLRCRDQELEDHKN